MIVPTIGRVVWVIRPEASSDFKQPEIGFVVYVHSTRYINVIGFDHHGNKFFLSSLYLVQDDEPKPGGDFACWMPYQKGQAAKNEQLETKVAGRVPV